MLKQKTHSGIFVWLVSIQNKNILFRHHKLFALMSIFKVVKFSSTSVCTIRVARHYLKSWDHSYENRDIYTNWDVW